MPTGGEMTRTGAKAVAGAVNGRSGKAAPMMKGLWEHAVFAYEVVVVMYAAGTILAHTLFSNIWARIDLLSREGSSTEKVAEGWETIRMNEVDKGASIIVPAVTSATFVRGWLSLSVSIGHLCLMFSLFFPERFSQRIGISLARVRTPEANRLLAAQPLQALLKLFYWMLAKYALGVSFQACESDGQSCYILSMLSTEITANKH